MRLDGFRTSGGLPRTVLMAMCLAKRPMVIDRRQLPVRTRLVLSMVLFNAWNIVETADVCHRPLFREFSGIGRCMSCPAR